jgi:hypothetical protein
MCKQRKEIFNQIKEFAQISLQMWTCYRQIYKKKDNIEGKDINLATLLIPLYDCPTKHLVVANGIEVNVTGKPDKNLYHSWKIIRSFPRTYVRTYYSFF